MALANFLLCILVMGISLQLLLTVTAAPSGTASKVGTETDGKAKPDLHHESGPGYSKHSVATVKEGAKSISLGFKPSSSGLVKRDAEQEADSANGKTPFYIFKKDFYHPNTRRFLTSNANQKDFSVFPPYTGAGGVSRYQRYRRSFDTDPSFLPPGFLPMAATHFRHPVDEMELQLNNNRDKEAFLRLMALLASKESNQLPNYNYNLLKDDFLPMMREDDYSSAFQDDDDLPLPIDLGYYEGAPADLFTNNGKHPAVYEMDGGSPAADLTRMGIHLSELPGSHGLYISPQAQQDIDDEWLEDAVPLQSHLKTRRSDDTFFRFNPVKSHFRRYLRSPFGPSSFGSSSFSAGRFGPFYPGGESTMIRKRRSYPAKAAPYTM